MSLFALTKRDINKFPLLITFEYSQVPVVHRSRVWSEVIRIGRFTQFLIVLANGLLVTAVAAFTAWLLVFTTPPNDIKTWAGTLGALMFISPFFCNTIKLARYMYNGKLKG